MSSLARYGDGADAIHTVAWTACVNGGQLQLQFARNDARHVEHIGDQLRLCLSVPIERLEDAR
jgi:hypothetical protein